MWRGAIGRGKLRIMSDETRIGSGRPGSSGIDLIKQGLGLNLPAGGRATTAATSAPALGPSGQRMLSPDTPLDSLDRKARRGTYLDILV